jgi:hypothetical protein
MTIEQLQEWVALGARLSKACPEKLEEIVEALKETVGVQETIASYDWQLWLTGKRPGKSYQA